MISAQFLRDRKFPELVSHYHQRDAALYALGLGLSTDPLDEADLRFTFEAAATGFQVMPTFAVTLGHPGFWLKDADVGADWVRLVHGEQRLELYCPLPVAASVSGRNRVTHVIDKGPGKGAIVVVERRLHDTDSGAPIARMEQVIFLRGDGGFPAGERSDAALAPLPKPPQTAPTHQVSYVTAANLALIYRLASDPNPLHADPAVARKAGFKRPILHGLATYGIGARALIACLCAGQAHRLRAIAARFSAPVYPGDTLRIDIWSLGETAHFEITAIERNVEVVRCGVAQIAP